MSMSSFARASLSLHLLLAATSTPTAASSTNVLVRVGNSTQGGNSTDEGGNSTHAKNPRDRIVGGRTADNGRHPYAVPIEDDEGHFCGGSLVASNAVLTAAHCFYGLGLEGIRVRVGSDDVDGGTAYDIKDGEMHPDYDPFTDEYDLYVIILDGEVTDVPMVRVNADEEWPTPGMTATAMGWGLVGEASGIGSDELLVAEVDIISNEECKTADEDYAEWISDDMICAHTPGKDACQGDSGGPAVIASEDDDPENDVLFGVVSWGVGCARMPGVYARPSAAYDWIATVVCDEHDGEGSLCDEFKEARRRPLTNPYPSDDTPVHIS